MTGGNAAEPAVNLDDVRAAHRMIREAVNRTPVMTSRTLDGRAGGTVYLKCESFQRSGSFKFRGASHAVARLTGDGRSGVLTYSSGNHAQALALAASLAGVPATVVMPRSAPAVKRKATEGYGAEVVLFDESERVREELAAEIAEQRGLTIIPPYDHEHIVAGQGTAALELIDEVGDLDRLYVPCGGGGLLSGSSLAASSLAACEVIGVEPEAADDATRTFRTGTLHRVKHPETIADGLRTPSLGSVTWPIIRDHVSEMRTVSEMEIVEAMRFLWTRMKLVVEPSGAVALAALLRDPPGRKIRSGVIISGGNVDLATALRLMRED